MNASLRRMTTGDKVVAAGLIVMLIASFLPWITAPSLNIGGVDYGGGSVNGYHSWGFLFWVVTYVLIAFWIFRVLIPDIVTMGDLPFADSVAFLAGGVIALVGALLYQVHDTGFYSAGSSFSNLGWGWFVALAGAVILLVGGYMKHQEPRSASYSPPSTPASYGSAPPYTPGPQPSPPPQGTPPQMPPPAGPPQQQPPRGNPPPPPA